MDSLIPFVPPPDYLPEFLTGFVALTISFLAIIELVDNVGERPVVTTLLPIALIILVHVLIIDVSYFVWYADYEYKHLRMMIFAQVPTRFLYNTLDAIIYAQRSRSILMFQKLWRPVVLAFLFARLVLQTVLQCVDVSHLYRADTFTKFLDLAFSSFSSVNTTSQIVIPALQAIFVDGFMLFIIVHMLRRAGKHVSASRKRVLRILLLIFTSIGFLAVKMFSSNRSRAEQSLASGGIVIIIALGAYVNFDLYSLDMALFRCEENMAEADIELGVRV